MPLVSGQIVDDDDIAGPQCRHQTALQVFAEDGAVHRTIDDEGSSETIQSIAANHPITEAEGQGDIQ